MEKCRSQKHLVFIIGTRAQLIKVAPVIVESEKNGIKCTLVMTGQHLETMRDLIDEFGIKSQEIEATKAKENSSILSLIAWLPKAYLGVLRQLEKLSVKSREIDVLVHGDTLSTVLGALAGRQLGARVVHLESGLTSHRIFDPFPEEISRRIVFSLSHIAMCPNQETLNHMKLKYPKCKAVNTDGNTILDSIKITGISRTSKAMEQPYLVVSLHRFQNIYNKPRIFQIVELLERVSQSHKIKFVLHPATRKRLIKYGLLEQMQKNSNIELIPRLGYSAFLRLAADSACVLTDGGSNQEELAALRVPTIIMRQATERTDGLGENAAMESDLIDGVLAYIANKDYRSLEGKGAEKQDQRPSANVINFLTSPCLN